MNYRTGKWAVEIRAKKSPYVRGLEKRTGRKIQESNQKLTVGGNDLLTKASVVKFIKRVYPWAVIVKIRPSK